MGCWDTVMIQTNSCPCKTHVHSRQQRRKPITTMECDVPRSQAMSCTTWKRLECCKWLLHLERPWFDSRKSSRAHLPSTSSEKQLKKNPLKLFIYSHSNFKSGGILVVILSQTLSSQGNKPDLQVYNKIIAVVCKLLPRRSS